MQTKDFKQVLDAAKTALAVEQDNYGVDQLKYEQGTISKNALLTAEDDLAAAQDTVEKRAGREFISIEEFATCCSKLSKTHSEQL